MIGLQYLTKQSTKVEPFVSDGSRKTRISQRSSVTSSFTSAATDDSEESIPWRYRLFGRPLRKQSVPYVEDKPKRSKKKAKKSKRGHKKNNRVSPAPEQPSSKKPKNPSRATRHQDKVVPFVLSEDEDEEILLQKVLPPEPQKKKQVPVTRTDRQLKYPGFPNPAQMCYLISILQSFLTMGDFVKAISRQEQVWSWIPEAALMRSLMDIFKSHLSSNSFLKIRLLASFKTAVSTWAPQFRDLRQKDAHEFLTSVLQQMRGFGPQMHAMAASMAKVYTCPVEEFLVVRMKITRTCKRCGTGSTREEEFTNLSLDLVPGGGTVEQMLQNYLMETELEYKCECGAHTSGRRLSFANLPRVLVLHLKRFRYTPFHQLEKVHDPVEIFRDLVVSSNQGGACYSLVSAISHIGLKARSGHYICDGVDPDIGLEDPTDRWFTYNDAEVNETNGAAVCARRQRTAYILFYKRQD